MLFVAKINEEKKIEMNEQEKKLFGIEKLNIKRKNSGQISLTRIFWLMLMLTDGLISCLSN